MDQQSLKDLFHSIGNTLPEEQDLIVIPPETTVRDAFKIMKKHNFNQVPVITGKELLGVFSYRAFAEAGSELIEKERNIYELPVEAFCEDLKIASIYDELESLLVEFDLKDAVLVGSDKQVQGIVTAVDALRYFFEVASAYVMLGEIELAIRELMRSSMDTNELNEGIDRCIRTYYEGKSLHVPTSLEEMSFNDYIAILKFKGYWEKFKDTFGGVYSVVQTKLDPLPNLRNDVFHFRRKLTFDDYDTLRDVRDWLLKRVKKLEAKRKIDRSE